MSSTNKVRTIKQIVNAIEQSEGAGARVRRSIGVMTQRKFNPFLMFDHFSSSGTNGFPEHPHRGQETITLVLHGAMAHEDFTGSKGVLYPGDLQFMTAGKGVVHSEMPIANKDGSPTVGLQLWVDLPDKLKDCEPRYRDLREWEIPTVEQQDGKLKIKVISGKSYGVESVKDLAYTPIEYYHYTVGSGGHFKQDLDPKFNFFLYVLRGDGLVLNGGERVKQFQNAFLSENGDHITGENKGSDEVEFILVGGEKLEQETVQYGPFVSNSSLGIQKAFMDYQYARNGFENIKKWKTLISGGVTQDMIDGPLGGNKEAREEMKKEYLESH
ncbi:uncharacterized protein KQ657_001758 [Scheffersomyces spartinae]|uniref:Pirin n=1 Tax=Scheffersomyces spartinae TaxID=45513 RepID=A0A9P8AHP1_9ASCO|nr:uncharacterized protein KQ657_001758 [Scheffersomyces spartinae]KAG7192359.1 hypothetical protein KQ657_001758 [Scheffersomyces spartinae]